MEITGPPRMDRFATRHVLIAHQAVPFAMSQCMLGHERRVPDPRCRDARAGAVLPYTDGAYPVGESVLLHEWDRAGAGWTVKADTFPNAGAAVLALQAITREKFKLSSRSLEGPAVAGQLQSVIHRFHGGGRDRIVARLAAVEAGVVRSAHARRPEGSAALPQTSA